MCPWKIHRCISWRAEVGIRTQIGTRPTTNTVQTHPQHMFQNCMHTWWVLAVVERHTRIGMRPATCRDHCHPRHMFQNWCYTNTLVLAEVGRRMQPGKVSVTDTDQWETGSTRVRWRSIRICTAPDTVPWDDS